MTDSTRPLNADLDQRIAIDTEAMEWIPSPGGQVLRKRLHRVGPAEAGQVTSLVRYPPGSRFPAHNHPEGEEILVLEGVFSDEQGDWPAGTHLLNPEGFRHAPHSEPGCLLFVKLRQYPGADRHQQALQTHDETWRRSVRRSSQWKKLYAQEPYTDFMRIERWETPAELGTLHFSQGAELLVLRGAFSDDSGHYPLYSWLRLPAGSTLTPSSHEECELYIKEGGFTYLKEA